MSAADLERLAGQADALAAEAGTDDQADAGTPAPGAPAPQADSLAERNMRGLCMLLAMARTATMSPLVFDPPLTSLRQLNDDRIEALAGPWAHVLTHYGFDPFREIERPEIAAVMLTGPTLAALWADVRDELRARRAKPIRPEPDSPDPGRGE